MTRVAVVIDRLHPDVESVLRDISETNDLLVISDERTPRVEEICAETGADLLVASHRLVDDGEGLTYADRSLASKVAASHDREPLDAIVYATDALVDLAAWNGDLAEVRVGRVMTGILSRAGVILGSSDLFCEEGAQLIALAGSCALADFVIAPHRRLPINRRLSPYELAFSRGLDTGAGPGFVDAIGAGLDDTIDAVTGAGERQAGLLTVVGSDPAQGDALQSTLAVELRSRVIFVLEDDPWAADSAGANQVAEAESASIRLPEPRPRPEVVIVDSTDLGDLMSELDAQNAAESSRVVLAVTAGSPTPGHFTGDRAMLADLVFAATPRTPMGDIDPTRVRDDLIAIGPRARRAAISAAETSDDLRTLIYRLTEPTLTTSAVVGLLPAEVSDDSLPLRVFRAPHDAGSRLVPALLPLANIATEPVSHDSVQFDPKKWLGSKRWSTRWRFALPWRWGLLPRAMKGRW